MNDVSNTPRADTLLARISRPLYAWLTRRLQAPRADRTIVVLGALLLVPSLNTGLAADDYIHQLMLDGSHELEGFVRAPLDIFRFCGPKFSPLLLQDGVFTWWDDMNARLSFMRPVSALTHFIDHALFRELPWVMHLHSLLWSVLVLLGVRALYRELVPDAFVANVALALYALDDARGWFVSWIAARNAVVATAFSVWALVLHHRARRRQSLPLQLGALFMLALALLSGEGSVATCGYLLAYAWFMESGPRTQRIVRLWPYAALLVVWRVAYRKLDYGVSGSSLYVDPLHDPLTFLSRVVEHGPVLLSAQLGGAWSDLWSSMFLFPGLRVAFYLASVAGVMLVGVFIAPRVKGDPFLQYALAAALLAVLPVSGVFPADRLLTWVGIGSSIVMATVLAPYLRGEVSAADGGWLPRGFGQLVAFLLIVQSLVINPLLVPSRARGNEPLREVLARADSGVPRDPSIRDKTLVFVNPPAVPLAAYIPITRAALGVPRAKVQRILATSTTDLTVTRIGPRTLRLTPRGDFLINPASRLIWSERTRPFKVGEHIALGELDVLVTRVTFEHKPIEIEVTFPKPLEDASYVWRQWLGTGYTEFSPPLLGTQVILPGADYLQVLFGVKFPFEARIAP